MKAIRNQPGSPDAEGFPAAADWPEQRRTRDPVPEYLVADCCAARRQAHKPTAERFVRDLADGVLVRRTI